MDDTDSNERMCTTYLAVLIADALEKEGFGTVSGYVHLIRLNPSVPYKTRGNAALGFEFNPAADSAEFRTKLISFVSGKIIEYAETECEKTNPGAVFIFEENDSELKNRLNLFFKKAVTDLVEIDEAQQLLSQYFIPHLSLKNGRGLIGALAVCGALMNPGWDETYEYLAYRFPEKWNGTAVLPRFVDTNSLIAADKATYPKTWDTVDYSEKKNPFPVCVPGSGDPVLFGLRGESPEVVLEAAERVVSEPVYLSAVFKTNQGTDAHLISVGNVTEMQPLHSYILTGTVVHSSKTNEGGHDIFVIQDQTGNLLECAAFEPTGSFRKVIRALASNDSVTVYGSFKNNTLNLEKIEVLSLTSIFAFENPTCPACQKRMESAGKGQGFRCRNCKTKSGDKIKIPVPRKIKVGFYEVPPSARRHLSKPLIRMKIH
ncbi:tRNA(Ile)(2)-agmatinylcytidine synthase [Methanolapillus millepedarum]